MNQRDRRRREKIKTFFFSPCCLSKTPAFSFCTGSWKLWCWQSLHLILLDRGRDAQSVAASSEDSHAWFRVLLFLSTLWFFLCPWCVFEVQEMWNYFLQWTLVQEFHIYHLCSLVPISIFISCFKMWIIFFLPLTCFILQLNFSSRKVVVRFRIPLVS